MGDVKVWVVEGILLWISCAGLYEFLMARHKNVALVQGELAPYVSLTSTYHTSHWLVLTICISEYRVLTIRVTD